MSEQENVEAPEDVCGDGGVMKEILRAGEGEETPNDGDDCKVHYVGTLLDGSKFDSSRDRGTPFEFTVGQGVIKGWSECAKTMRKGELCKVTLGPEYAYGVTGSPPKIPANATLVFEIELLSFGGKEVDCTKKKNGGIIKKKTLKSGKKTWMHPDYESTVTYDVKIFKGDLVYLDEKGKNSSIGDPSNFHFVESALKNLSEGERGHFAVKSSSGFAAEGNKDLNVPPHTDFEMEVELVAFKKGKEDWGLSFEEKIEVTNKRKAEGNDYFQKGHFRAATKKYQRGLKTFEHEKEKELDADNQKALKEVRLPSYLNLAACQLKLKNPKKALTSTEKALEIDPRNVKALWRHGLALQDLGDWDAAKKNFEEALAIEPDNKTVATSLAKVKQIISNYDKKQQALYKNLFA